MSEKDFFEKRKILVQNMVQSEVLKSPEIKKAFLSVKREIFFSEGMKKFAYENNAFPIGFGQTISQPSTIAVMLELLDAQKGMKTLEIGSGSAYVLALLSKIVGFKGKVFGIELVPELRGIAEKNLNGTNCKNIKLLLGNGCNGWREKAPFDRVLISAACREIPKALEAQLNENGKIVVPIGNNLQEIVLAQKKKGFLEEKERKCCFLFVPLHC
jgi:protein-L-isoaspartate(D-aspartate) O-methyltransferase